MKSLTLFGLLFFSAFSFTMSAYAQDRVGSGGVSHSSSYKRRTKIDAIEFYRTLDNPELNHPDNKRDPNWPDRLTFERVEPMSQDEFHEKLEGTWRVVYHCNGTPAPSRSSMGDHKNPRGYMYFKYDKDSFKRIRNKDENNEKENSQKVDEQGAYSVKSLSDNKFEISYPGIFGSERAFFVRIKETRQLAIITDEAGTNLTCPDGTVVQLFRIKLNDQLM